MQLRSLERKKKARKEAFKRKRRYSYIVEREGEGKKGPRRV
jgi:hypothetical protein